MKLATPRIDAFIKKHFPLYARFDAWLETLPRWLYVVLAIIVVLACIPALPLYLH